MKHLIITALLLVCFGFAGAKSYAGDHTPTEQLQPVLKQLIEVLDDESLKGDGQKTARRSKIMAIISSGFDFKEMSRRVLGSTWNEISDTDREHFVTQFTKLLENV